MPGLNARIKVDGSVGLRCKCGHEIRVKVLAIEVGGLKGLERVKPRYAVIAFPGDPDHNFRIALDDPKGIGPPIPPPVGLLAFGASVVAARRPGPTHPAADILAPAPKGE